MVLAHAPISYLVNEKIQKENINKLKFHEQVLVALFSLFFGILPDFDFFSFFLIHSRFFLISSHSASPVCPGSRSAPLAKPGCRHRDVSGCGGAADELFDRLRWLRVMT